MKQINALDMLWTLARGPWPGIAACHISTNSKQYVSQLRLVVQHGSVDTLPS